MKIEPIIIGIPGWKWKRDLVHYARKYPRIGRFALKKSMCHECSRHFEILGIFDSLLDLDPVGEDIFKKSGDDFYKDSEYYQFYQKQNKEHKKIMEKIYFFYKLYQSIMQNGYSEKNPPIITYDGCRLDGSHRMSIQIHRGAKWIDFNIARYDKAFKAKKANRIKEKIIKYRREVYGLTTWTEKS